MSSQQFTADTSIAVTSTETRCEIGGLVRSMAGMIFGLRLAAASTEGIRQCFLEQSSGTQLMAGAFTLSSTGIPDLTPDSRAKLDAILDDARRDIIEDGMPNAITERLPGLIANDFSALMPTLMSIIEDVRIPPVIAAEVLKELGRGRNAASHASRLWILERSLGISAPFIRDGAGLGLARLGDASAIPYLRRAAENEPHAQTRADLQLVIDELGEIGADGVAVTRSH
jgi:hypothetical protein